MARRRLRKCCRPSCVWLCRRQLYRHGGALPGGVQLWQDNRGVDRQLAGQARGGAQGYLPCDKVTSLPEHLMLAPLTLRPSHPTPLALRPFLCAPCPTRCILRPSTHSPQVQCGHDRRRTRRRGAASPRLPRGHPRALLPCVDREDAVRIHRPLPAALPKPRHAHLRLRLLLSRY